LHGINTEIFLIINTDPNRQSEWQEASAKCFASWWWWWWWKFLTVDTSSAVWICMLLWTVFSRTNYVSDIVKL